MQTYTIPNDLKGLIYKTTKIDRYKDPRYPTGFIRDTLFDHLIRLQNDTQTVQIKDKELQQVKRTLWIHDLGEIITGDIPAVLKADGLAKEPDEKAELKKMLSKEDLVLYSYFELSGKFLVGKGSKFSRIGIISKTLDSIDGNKLFHSSLAKWVINGNKNLPPETAMTYTFTQKDKYKLAIKRIKDQELKKLLTALLNNQIAFINNLWKENLDLMPSPIKKYL